ncbi:SDR family oxidoreductase [Marinicella sp. W31]|uniref:SDR family oxidoreductase n=1 Tax=Marinicella sp. W31 TaxID=3023713 RepID=UPI00375715CB
MSININNKTALVTGANRGIGKAIVESFLSHGAKKVYLAVRNLESTNALVAAYGDRVQPVHVDLANAESIKQLAQQANDVEIVVNNAGVLEVANPLSENAESALNHELTVNTFGLLRMAQAFTPVLEQHNNSAFVQLNSVASIKNFADFTTYSASKAAAYSITQGLKETLAEKNVQVLSVHPGPIDTDMATQAGMGDGAESTNTVSEGIVSALQSGQFHLFPDNMAQTFEGAYNSYANNIIEADLSEG